MSLSCCPVCFVLSGPGQRAPMAGTGSRFVVPRHALELPRRFEPGAILGVDLFDKQAQPLTSVCVRVCWVRQASPKTWGCGCMYGSEMCAQRPGCAAGEPIENRRAAARRSRVASATSLIPFRSLMIASNCVRSLGTALQNRGPELCLSPLSPGTPGERGRG